MLRITLGSRGFGHDFNQTVFAAVINTISDVHC